MVLPLHIFEARYRDLVADLLARPDDEPREFGVVAIRQGWEVGEGPFGAADPALYEIGCTARVRAVNKHDDGRYDLVCIGAQRFRTVRVVTDRSAYLQADVVWLPGEETDDVSRPEAAALAKVVGKLFVTYVLAVGDLHGRSLVAPDLPEDPRALSYLVAAGALLTAEDRQALLEPDLTTDRLRAQSRILRRELTVLATLHAVPMPLAALAIVPGRN